jgi:hypothetical protein
MENSNIDKIKNLISKIRIFFVDKFLLLKERIKKGDRVVFYYLYCFIAMIIVFIGIFTIVSLNKTQVKYKFYFIDYYGKIKYEKINVSKGSTIDEIIFIYLSGPYNRKKFSSYIFNIKYYDKYELRDNNLILVLNEEGIKAINEIDKKIFKLIGIAVKKTFLIHNLKIKKIIFISYFTNLKLYEIEINN